MTESESAATEPTLHPFEGNIVAGTVISVEKAGAGLTAALEIEPEELAIGDVVHVVLRTVVGPVSFEPIKGTTGVVQRKHKLLTEVATIVDGDLVETTLTAQEEKIEAERLRKVREKEAEKGVQRVPGTEPWGDGNGEEGDVSNVVDGDFPAGAETAE